MTDYTQNLQENLIARLCHDLANDLGSLQLGLDNLAAVTKKNKNKDPLQEKITKGLAQSTQSALAKHAFYRLAYGSASNFENVSFTDLKKIIDRFNGHAEIRFTHESDRLENSLEADQAKLLLNLYGLCVEMIPYGGQIHLRPGPATQFELHADEVIRFNQEAPLSPRTVHFHYCKSLAEAGGFKLSQGDGTPALLGLT